MAYDDENLTPEKRTQRPIPNDRIGRFSERLESLVDECGSVRSYAIKAGLSEGVIRKYLKGGALPTLDRLDQLAYAANVNIAWLARGEDPKISEAASSHQTTPSEEYAYVTLYDAECSAGSGSWNDECRPLTQLAFTKYSLRKKGLDAKTLSAIRVTGDSMEGDLSDGDAVMIDHAKTEVKGEGIYVIRLDGHLYAKRLQRTLDGVEIISTNKAYKTTHVPKERLNELDVIGQVVWAASWTI
ncbi:S24 family peptidase [Neptunomonas sp.]|uniref:XRE family transcriptional regulator n=1 Tax=Neptunomonas sp. TaxID=1971898 RepID=UPI0025E0506C|nr:S24 family peptidase [Neptunomonas sp.]